MFNQFFYLFTFFSKNKLDITTKQVVLAAMD